MLTLLALLCCSYFSTYIDPAKANGQKLAISVHCSISIFAYLWAWAQRCAQPLRSENVLPVLISSSFLQAS